MTIIEFIRSEYVSVIAGAVGGVTTGWLTHRVLNKRGTFSYFVQHSPVGLTVEDQVFGRVTAQWNGQEISNLYISNIEIKNESMNDYENIVIRAYTTDTRLLSEKTQIAETPHILEWTDRFKEQLRVEPGGQPTDAQWVVFNGQREYVIPVLNRGQSVRLTYLNSTAGPSTPNIWLSVARKGVKIKFKVPQPLVFGVPRVKAALGGLLVGIAVVTGLLALQEPLWGVAYTALVLGFLAELPGAYAFRLWRKIYDVIGG